MVDLGAVVLCGGRSRRMGRPKEWLPFGDGELLLQRVVRLVAPAVGPIAVVAAADQALPPLPRAVRIVRDPVAGEGPLRGLAAGLESLASEARFAFVTASDAPFVSPAVVGLLRALCGGGHEAAAPFVDDRYHPLAAVYATDRWTAARDLLAAGERRATAFCQGVKAQPVTAAELAAVDPALACLRNVNTEHDYHAALAALARSQ